MSSPVVAFDVTARVHEALSVAHVRGVHHFPLMRNGALAGLVCTCDLERASLEDGLERYMHAEVVTIQGRSSAKAAAALLDSRRVGSLVVLDGQEVAGIVTRADLARGKVSGVAPEAVVCARCGSQHRLRHTADGRYACADCAKPGPPFLECGFGD